MSSLCRGSSTATRRRPISRPDERGARNAPLSVTAVCRDRSWEAPLRCAPTPNPRWTQHRMEPLTWEAEREQRRMAERAAASEPRSEPPSPSEAALVMAPERAPARVRLWAVTPAGAAGARYASEAASGDRRTYLRHPLECRGGGMERRAQLRRTDRRRRSRCPRRRSVPSVRGVGRDVSVRPCGRRRSRS
jgi:hypothetical protein